MLNRSIASRHRPASPRIAPVAGASALAMAALCAVSPGRAHANLVITPTFDSSIINDPNAAALEGTINSAIGALQADISTPINVSVYFQETTSFGGSSGNNTSPFYSPYGSFSDPRTNDPITGLTLGYYDRLKAIDTAPEATSAQRAAFASLGAAPGVGSGNPVNGADFMEFTSANARALGFDASPDVPAPMGSSGYGNGQLYDSIVYLDPTLTYPPHPNNGSNYSLKPIVLHELDEVLGIGGGGSQLSITDNNAGTNNQPGAPSLGPVGPMDLFRYSAPGVRSFTLYDPTTPYSYFSIDGGNTVLSYFNQSELHDYGDWLSYPTYPTVPAGYGPQVQDANATPGADPALGVNELTSLNVIGYTLAVPEPSTMGIALCGLLPMLLRRRRAVTTAG
jgi:hypothetical protein